MSKPSTKQADQQQTKYSTTFIELTKRPDGTWEATQDGLTVVGTGDSAARATENMARQIAEQKEAGEN